MPGVTLNSPPPFLIFGEVLLQFVARDGARADNGQIALEHVEKQWHLLDGAHADELAHLCDAWVGTDLALNLALVELDGAQTLLHITASETMLRSLSTRITRPPLPTRSCV